MKKKWQPYIDLKNCESLGRQLGKCVFNATTQAACPTGVQPVLAWARRGSPRQNSPTGPSLGQRWAGHLNNKTKYFKTLFNVSCSPLEIR